jgi:glucan phosphoethanolaminetransferase (alkaline phosphatase superfamily)
MIITAIVYIGAMFIFGIVIAFRMSKIVKAKKFNEAKLLAYMIYGMTLPAVIIVAFQLSGTLERDELFTLRSVGIIAHNLIVVVVFFGTKLYWITTNADIDGEEDAHKFVPSSQMSRKSASEDIKKKQKQIDALEAQVASLKLNSASANSAQNNSATD